MFTRREIIEFGLVAPALAALGRSAAAQSAPPFTLKSIAASPAYATTPDGSRADGVEVVRRWNGSICRAEVVNRGRAAVRLKDLVLFDLPIALPAATAVYGEGFQMLSQTGGTLGALEDFSQYTDAKHYRLPEAIAGPTFYGVLTLTPPGEETRALAFTSCARFVGRFQLRGSALQGVLDAEGLELGAGARWTLEEFSFTSGPARAYLLRDVAARLAKNHPRLPFAAPPAGWCSWYCFGARVTAQQVLDNLDVIARTNPALKYIQIDDGYQPAMGDWLETGAAFGGSVQTVLAEIRKRGFQPAIWVAPFIAEAGSHLFQQHPDWFVKDSSGEPLRADKVTFGGWRRGPWYAVDGTHPGVQTHFEQVFRTMRREWGCTYFKLDANFWGAIHGGRFHDPRATRVEAYRRGMRAIRRGAGDAFLLGCNHPIWPSIGEIHGSRSSNDIRRSWDRIASTAKQNLSRNWQNGVLWWNDPDAVCLSELTDAELQFHATAIYASGGMILSGDDLTTLAPARAAMLNKLLPPTGVAARFGDANLRYGVVPIRYKGVYCLFNWRDEPDTMSLSIPQHAGPAVDFWTGEKIAIPFGDSLKLTLPGRSARLLVTGDPFLTSPAPARN